MSMENSSPICAKKILLLALRAQPIKIETVRQYFKPGFFHHFKGISSRFNCAGSTILPQPLQITCGCG